MKPTERGRLLDTHAVHLSGMQKWLPVAGQSRAIKPNDFLLLHVEGKSRKASDEQYHHGLMKLKEGYPV